jgi:hypothetical protein
MLHIQAGREARFFYERFVGIPQAFKRCVRNIHAGFEPFMLQNPHGYCVISLIKQITRPAAHFAKIAVSHSN